MDSAELQTIVELTKLSLVTIRANNDDELVFENQRLVDALVREFRNPSSESKEPYFEVKEQPPLNRVHVVVIWDSWKNLSHQERSEIIMDAYEQWRGTASGTAVSVAMGLTQREAERLGLRVEVETGEPVRIG